MTEYNKIMRLRVKSQKKKFCFTKLASSNCFSADFNVRSSQYDNNQINNS